MAAHVGVAFLILSAGNVTDVMSVFTQLSARHVLTSPIIKLLFIRELV